jgi:cytochrome P450 family 6
MFIYLAAAIVVLIVLYFKHFYSYWEKRGFPYIPGKFPLGSINGMGFKEHSCEFFKRHYDHFKDKGPAFGLFFLLQTSVVITDPELIKDVYTRNFESFHERGFFINEKSDPLSAHLFALGGQKWKNMRGKLSPTFTSGRMKMMFPLVVKAADRMINHMRPHAKKVEQFEVKEVYAEFTTEVIASVAFGLDIECLGNPDSEFRKVSKSLFEPTGFENMKIMFIFAFPTLAKFFNMRFISKKSADFFMGVIRDTLEYREKNKVERNDFLQLLINIKDNEDGLTFNEIAANSFIFFSAG